MRETFGGGGTGELRAVSESSLISVGDVVSKDDLLYLCGLSGKGLPVHVTDYAAAKGLTHGTPQTDAATGRIVAQSVRGEMGKHCGTGCISGQCNEKCHGGCTDEAWHLQDQSDWRC